MGLLPEHTKPRELAKHLEVSERTLREMARKLGAYRMFGKEMILLKSDVEAIMEAARPCRSQFTAAAKSGTTEAPLPGGDYAALREHRTKPSHKGSRQKPKPASGVVTSMARGRT